MMMSCGGAGFKNVGVCCFCHLGITRCLEEGDLLCMHQVSFFVVLFTFCGCR